MRLFDVAQRYFDGADAGLPALAVLLDRGQVERDRVCPIRIWQSRLPGYQPALPVAVVANGLKRLNLDQAARKPFENPPAWSTCDRGPGNWLPRCTRRPEPVFHVQQNAEITAELGAIFMCDAGKLLGA